MVKKSKTGKSRKDEYYHMAKNTGLRARSSFKLIEINKLFHILENATILIDLCAAPGGWMQIAAKTMKKSSFIIGVDLVPIKPIPGTISIVADITTEKCKTLIKKHILKAKADVILHDGAPNVGANWNVDEFQQAHLCLKAFALATDFLVKNGTFITKVFRSKDYEPLKWVFDQLFEKVQVVKPRSSRAESAEIFLVCLKYKAPAFIDPKFLDIQHVFEDVEPEETEMTYATALKKKKKALGYEEGDTLYKEVKVSDLVQAPIPMNILFTANKILFDDEDIRNHPLTTDVVKQYVQDLKLLGKVDFKLLEKWLKKMVSFYKKLHKAPEPEIELVETVEKTEEEQIQDEIDKCEDEIKKHDKKKLRKARKEKMKQIKLIQMSMLHPGDVIDQDNDVDMFSASKNQHLIDKGIIQTDVDISVLDKIIIPMDTERRSEKNKIRPTKETFVKGSDKSYEAVVDVKTFSDSDVDSADGNSEEEEEPMLDVDEYAQYDDEDIVTDEESGDDEDDDEEEDEDEEEYDDDEDSELVIEGESDVDLDAEEKMEVEDDEEIEEDIGSEDEDDEENYEDASSESDDDKPASKRQKITDLNFDPNAPTPKAKETKRLNSWFNGSEFEKLMNDVDEDDEDESDSSSGEEAVEDISEEKKSVKSKKVAPSTEDSDKIDVANPEHKIILNTLKRKLTPKERALAVEMIKSKKSRREILEWGYNRFMFDEEKNLPGWFVADEKKHMVARLPFVDKSKIDAQKVAVSTNINKRTIKKVEQAKARKKHHLVRKLTRLNKRAEKMDDDLMEVEKRKKLQDLSKKVHKLKNTKKPVVTEVTNKNGQRNRVGAYKKGAKVKVVDKRMKSDSRVRGAKDKKKNNKRGKK